MKTRYDINIPDDLVGNYFNNLINLFYKILPMRENGETTLQTYMESLAFELVGAKELVETIRCDAQFLSLLSILESLISQPDCEVPVVKREVFRAISICNKIIDRYGFRRVAKR